MGTELKTDDVATTRTKSWRDTVAADYEITQARLHYALEEADDVEEFL